MNLSNLKSKPWVIELRENTRLQWLCLLVFSILLLSLGKGFANFVDAKSETLYQQELLLSKLKTADARPLNEALVESHATEVERLKSVAMKAASASVAEAQALTRADGLLSNRIEDGRATLINTEETIFGTSTFWQVRIEIRGKLTSENLIPLLDEFDGELIYQRLNSMNYRPKASNTITFVFDYLFMQEA